MGISLKPSDAVEGGAVPFNRNLLWKECRFNLFNYPKKDGTPGGPNTTALRITYVDDEGAEYEQQYSVGNPERFLPSDDGKSLIPVGDAQAISKSCNYFLLISALVNAGFPENKIGDDISILDGTYTYNISMPIPKRDGLARAEAAGGREPVLSVPSQLLRAPWEKEGKSKTASKKAAETEESGEDVTEAAIAFVAEAVEETGTITRQQLATRLFKKLAKDPNKDAIATLLFKPEFQGALLANGFTVDGEEVSKAE